MRDKRGGGVKSGKRMAETLKLKYPIGVKIELGIRNSDLLESWFCYGCIEITFRIYCLSVRLYFNYF